MHHSRSQKILSAAIIALLTLGLTSTSLLNSNQAQADGESFITGKTFYDANKNGINDAGDTILPFLKVSLYQGTSLIQGPNSINLTGNYSFTIITPGTYHIQFSNLPPNYSFSAPNIGGDDTTDSDVNNEGLGMGSTDDIILVGGETVANVDAGAYVDNVFVGDFVWFDSDSDGIQDVGEVGAEAIDVELQDQNTNTVLGSDTTDGSGNYGISATLPACIGPNAAWTSGSPNMTCSNVNVAGGYYELTFTTSADCEAFGITITLEAANGNTLYSNGCGLDGGDLHNNTSYNFRVGPEIGTGQAHINFTEAGSSNGIANIMLIYQKNRVHFSNVAPGQGFSTQYAIGDNTLDSDVDTGGYTNVIQLSTGEIYNNIDAGICNMPCSPPPSGGTASVGNFVWNDNNANGLQDDGELGVGGALVKLLRVSDNQVQSSASTDLTGYYSITNIPAGSYYIQVSAIAPGNHFTINDVNSNTNDDIDSDINPMTSFSTIFTLVDGQSKNDLDAGVVSDGGGGGDENGAIRMHIFTDNDGNGYQHNEESDGASGITITISNGVDSMELEMNGSGDINETVPQNLEGYSITFDLPEGTYVTAHPNPWENIIVYGGQLTDLGNIGIYTGPVGSFSLPLFTDNNGNGVQDEGEQSGASKVYIAINDTQWSPIPFPTNGTLSGYLAPGTYSFSIIADPPGEGELSFTGATAALTSVTIIAATNNALGAIGYYLHGDVSGGECDGTCGYFEVHIFDDANGNGSIDDGETMGFEGTQMRIQADGFDETFPFDETGTLGGNVSVGAYTLTILAPPGAEVTAGENPFVISVTDGSSASYVRGVHATGGTDCEGACGHVEFELFGDTNGNGTLDSGEIHNADGAQLHIEGSNDINMTIPFDPEGRAGGDIEVGTYTISIILPSGFDEITGGEHPFTIIVTDGSDNRYRRGARPVSGGDHEGECDELCGRILLHIFTDLNNNGTQQSWEPNSSSGTTVHVQGGDLNEVVVLDETGDVGGDVPNGTYTLTINKPTGTVITGGNNPVTFIVTTGSNTLATRGIYTTSGNGGGSSGGGAVIYGGGSNSGGSSGSWSSSNDSSSHRSRSSNRSNTTNNVTRDSPSTIPVSQPTSTLPVVNPMYAPCLLTDGIAPINFYDTNSTDATYLSSIIFTTNQANRLIHGDGNGHFSGHLPMTRFELLKIAMSSNCVAGGEFTIPNTTFEDVSHDSSEASRVIGEAQNRGIVQGQSNRFYPNRAVTMGEFIKMLLGSSAYFPNGQPLQSLPVTETTITEPSFIQPIEYAKLLGILEGNAPINQNQIVTRDEMATIVARYIRAMNGLVIVN